MSSVMLIVLSMQTLIVTLFTHIYGKGGNILVKTSSS